MQRQEPQGQEQVYYTHSVSKPSDTNLITSNSSRVPDLSTSYVVPSSRNNDSNISMSSNTNTLIIHHSVPEESWSNRWLANYSAQNALKNLKEKSLPPTGLDSKQSFFSSKYGESYLPPSHRKINTYDLPINSHSNIRNFNPGNTVGSPDLTQISNIPYSYLDQSEVLKHLINMNDTRFNASSMGVNASIATSSVCSDRSASSSNSALNTYNIDRESASGSSAQDSQYISNLDGNNSDLQTLLHKLDNPPPAYQSWITDNAHLNQKESIENRAYKNALLSKSQPDLTKVGTAVKEQSPSTSNEFYPKFFLSYLDEEDNPTFLKELVDLLSRENSTLKLEIDTCRRRVAKLRKFEIEMTKVEEQYEGLVKLCERREQLEKLARHKLQVELQKSVEQNVELRNKVESLRSNQTAVDLSQAGMRPDETSQAGLPSSQTEIETNHATEKLNTDLNDLSSLRRELIQKDVAIAQIVAQSKELSSIKERQSMELTTLRRTLNEQRTHIAILDATLRNSQANALKLEQEVHKRQNSMDQEGQLKRLLLSVKISSDRREQSEKNLRQNLEMEILKLKSNTKMDDSESEASELRRELRARDERILSLETELSKWEQRFIQDSARVANLPLSIGQNRPTNLPLPMTKKTPGLQMLKRNDDDIVFRSPTITPTGKPPLSNWVNTSGCWKLDSSVQRPEKLISKDENRNAKTYDFEPNSENTRIQTGIFGPTSEQIAIGADTGKPVSRHNVQLSDSELPGPEKVRESELNTSGSYCCYVVHGSPSSNPTSAEVTGTVKSGDVIENYDQRKLEEVFLRNANEKAVKLPSPTARESIFPTVYGQPIPSPTSYGPLSRLETRSGAVGSRASSEESYQYDLERRGRRERTTSPLNLTVNSSESRSRGEPPPYFSHHQVLKNSQQSSSNDEYTQSKNFHKQNTQFLFPPQSMNQSSQVIDYASQNSTILPPPSPPLSVPMCQRQHPPNALCRMCLNVRRSHRQNAAAFLRRANSNASAQNRRSAPSSSDSLDDAPSILERLKKEWENSPSADNKNRASNNKENDDLVGSEVPQKEIENNNKLEKNTEINEDKGKEINEKQIKGNEKNEESVKRKETNANEIKEYKKEIKKIESSNKKFVKKLDEKNVNKNDVKNGNKIDENPDIHQKKNAADLDRALTRLSLRRNLNQCSIQSKFQTRFPHPNDRNENNSANQVSKNQTNTSQIRTPVRSANKSNEGLSKNQTYQGQSQNQIYQSQLKFQTYEEHSKNQTHQGQSRNENYQGQSRNEASGSQSKSVNVEVLNDFKAKDYKTKSLNITAQPFSLKGKPHDFKSTQQPQDFKSTQQNFKNTPQDFRISEKNANELKITKKLTNLSEPDVTNNNTDK